MKHVVVIGNGMVGARFAADLAERDTDARYRITVLGAEEHEPYNRVLLSDFVAGKVGAAALSLPMPSGPRVRVKRGAVAVGIDRTTRTVLCGDGTRHTYDVLVLATGAQARVPPLQGIDPGHLLPGVHVMRSLDDAREIVAATMNARRAVVIGGGVLGVEAACGLARRGLAVTLVHASAALMERQLSADASAVAVEMLALAGVTCVLSASTQGIEVHQGRASAVRLSDGRVLPADLVVMACGTGPATDLAQAAGLDCNRGIVVGEDLATPADPSVFAIGDCAAPPGGGTGLIAQGWEQARALVLQLLGHRRPGGSEAAPTDVVRVKGSGIDIVAMGAAAPGDRRVRLSDPQSQRFLEVAVREGRLVAATCIGAGSVAADLTAAYTRGTPVPNDPATLLVRPGIAAAPQAASPTAMPESFTVCRCNGVTKRDVMGAWSAGARGRAEVAVQTRATTGCGGCSDVVDGILDWLRAADPDPGPSQPSAPARARELIAAKQTTHGRETSRG